uniref:Wall-associated receptor kinase galacturonan-binding domain-containing protein n=2 Tax=Triticum urartu TaxID=4572 RepID=A0A8R7VB88_TRIUA
MVPSCWFFRALWLPLVLAVAAAEEQGEACSGSAKMCGNLTISRPFWLTDWEKGRPCGHPDFEVSCVNGSSFLRSSMPFSGGFAVVNISYQEESLHVVDSGKLYLLLDASNSCRVPIWNTSAKLGVSFSVNPGNLSLIVYNCTEEGAAAAVARRDRELVQTGLRCGNESEVLARAGVRYDATGNYSGYALEGCDASIVPVLGSSSGRTNASDYMQLIKDGFLLRWVRPPT